MWTVFLLLIHLAFKAWAFKITGHGDTSAEYGSEAHFKCELDDPKDVLQVTWQRLYEDNSIENLGTYSKRFGEQVNDPYKGKIVITEASLHSSSITVRNVSWADESCYVCSFNAYPGGSKRYQTCLKVQGVSDVETRVYPIDKPENKEVIFSCSATGKTAPKIQWDYSDRVTVVEDSQMSVLIHDDGTFTGSRNLTLRPTPDWDGQVYCVINPGVAGGKNESIIYTTIKEKTENEGSTSDIVIVTVILVIILVIILVCASVMFMVNRRNHQQICGQSVI